MNADLLISMVLNEGKRPPIHTTMVDATPAEQDTFGIPREDQDIFKRRRHPSFDRRVPNLHFLGNMRKVFRGDDLSKQQRERGIKYTHTPRTGGKDVMISKSDPSNPLTGLSSKDSPWVNAPFSPLPKSKKRQAHRDALIALGKHVRDQSLSKERGFIGWKELHSMADDDNEAFQNREAFGQIDPQLHSEYGRLINMEVDRMIDHHNRKATQRSRPGLATASGFNWYGAGGGEGTVYAGSGSEDDHDALDHSSVGAMPSVHGEIQTNLGRRVRAELKRGDRTHGIIDKHDPSVRDSLHNQLHLLFMGMDHIGGSGSKNLKIDSSHFSPAMKEIPDLNGAINMARKVRGI